MIDRDGTMSSQNTPGDIRAEVFETRIALSFFGGVSLAVYESGMAVEFFRLVSGDGIYRKLHEQIGPVKVDIISGTSAGGLSAAFLATCGSGLTKRVSIPSLCPLAAGQLALSLMASIS